MTPYYTDASVTIYHGDARDVMSSLAGTFDVLLTDPPYSSGGFQEAGRDSGSIGRRTASAAAPIYLDNLSTRGYAQLMRAVLREAAEATEVYVFTDWRMWIETFDAMEAAGWRVRNMLVWDKGQMGMGSPWRNQHELIAFGRRGPSEVNGGNLGNVIRSPRSRNEHHSTEKPVDLIAKVLTNTAPGVVLDPLMGSGSTLIAAKSLGRKAIGIEIEERYCEIAAQRCSQEVLGLVG